jgi:hypothetical protein
MTRSLILSMLRKGSNGEEILQILNTLTDGLASETDQEDFDSDSVDYEVEDSEVEEYEPDAELVAL